MNLYFKKNKKIQHAQASPHNQSPPHDSIPEGQAEIAI